MQPSLIVKLNVEVSSLTGDTTYLKYFQQNVLNHKLAKN